MNNIDQKPSSGREKLARELRHFGVDYLTLNVGASDNQKIPTSIAFLNSLFSLPYNLTNASEYNGIVWGAGIEELNLHFSYFGKDQFATVYRGEDKIMTIRKIGMTSNFPPAMKKKYQYQIQFYGAFFALARLGCFKYEDYWHPFLQDIQDGTVAHSISRLDICADIENANVRSIQRSIRGKGRMKEFSELQKDSTTGIPQTVYYGANSEDWKARIYNKTKEVMGKHKEDLYADYLNADCVTRVEIELHSKPCQEYAITLHQCLDLKCMLGIYERFLSNKAAHWGIIRFIKSELNKNGCTAIPARRIKISYSTLNSHAYLKRTINHVKECARRTGLSSDEVMEEIKLHLK